MINCLVSLQNLILLLTHDDQILLKMKTKVSLLFLIIYVSLGYAQPPVPPRAPERPNLIIDQTNDGITIAELLANKNSYANKTVKLKGKVIKYNSNILGKNWLHLQDGTDNSGENDITITTDMVTKVGDTITVVGKITLDKDIGSGYFYKVIMEDAKIIK